MLEDVAQHQTGPLELFDHVLMNQLQISGGVELIAGGGREKLECLALRRYYPEENLLQRLLNLMAEAVNGV
jgi:hypothetical protein